MSSILKALKKLEKESPQKEEPISWPQKIDTKKALSKRTKGSWRLKKLIAIFCVVVLLAAGGWLLLSQKPSQIKRFFAGVPFFGQGDEVGKTASMQVRKKVEKGPTPVSKREIIERKIPKPSRRSASRPDLPKKDSGPIVKSERPHLVKKEVNQKIPAQVKKTTEETLKTVSKEETEIGKKGKIPETKTSGPGGEQRKVPTLKKIEKPGSGELAEDKKFASAKIMDDSKVELQAIAWSIDPKKRIAVINGRVVREGASLEGFTITRIGKDEVFVVQGNELRKLVFTVK